LGTQIAEYAQNIPTLVWIILVLVKIILVLELPACGHLIAVTLVFSLVEQKYWCNEIPMCSANFFYYQSLLTEKNLNSIDRSDAASS